MADQTFLVTGANGFIGMHIILQAVQQGHHVRAVARSEKSLQQVLDAFPGHHDQISTVVVPDITVADNYKDAFGGVTAVIHTASPFTFSPTDNAKDLLDPAKDGAVAILEATKRYGTSVTHVVSTSSFAAVLDPSKGLRDGYTYDEKDWNPMPYEEAAKADPVTCYVTSKALAEKAQWEWIEANKPNFVFNVINPTWVLGPNAKAVPTKSLGESSHMLYGLLDAKVVPPPDFLGAVDVRDVASAHLLAASIENVNGERFILAQPFSWQFTADSLREDMPEIAARLPVDGPGSRQTGYLIDSSKAPRVLGFNYTPLRTTFKDAMVQYVEESEKLS